MIREWKMSLPEEAAGNFERGDPEVWHAEIMNTDRGSQVTSFAWTDRLKRVSTSHAGSHALPGN